VPILGDSGENSRSISPKRVSISTKRFGGEGRSIELCWTPTTRVQVVKDTLVSYLERKRKK
jgi:hypothetical protein